MTARALQRAIIIINFFLERARSHPWLKLFRREQLRNKNSELDKFNNFSTVRVERCARALSIIESDFFKLQIWLFWNQDKYGFHSFHFHEVYSNYWLKMF